jgi:hypothetical protein
MGVGNRFINECALLPGAKSPLFVDPKGISDND